MNSVTSRTARMIYEPKWKSLMANTIAPIFTPATMSGYYQHGPSAKSKKRLRWDIKKKLVGKYDTKMRITTISWIPFKALPDMYKIIERTMLQVNGNHFGYEGMHHY